MSCPASAASAGPGLGASPRSAAPVVEAFVSAGLAGQGSVDQGHLPLGAALARAAPAGRRGQRLSAALPPKRPYSARRKSRALVRRRLSALGVAAGVGAFVLGPRHRGRAAAGELAGRSR